MFPPASRTPFFSSLYFQCQSSHVYLKVLQTLQNSPFWQRKHGEDHIFTLTPGFIYRTLAELPELKNSILLLSHVMIIGAVGMEMIVSGSIF